MGEQVQGLEARIGEKMRVQIKTDGRLCENEQDYPLVLSCKIGEIEEDGMAFNLRYKLKIEGDGLNKRISGVVELGGVSSVNTLDDRDADNYHVEAERESINYVVDYLRKQFPGCELRGVIRGTSTTAYHGERKYKIP